MKSIVKRDAILGVVLAGASAMTSAQQTTLEEVLVTADKSEQNLQDVSVSVTAYSVAEIETRRILNTVDLADTTPGLLTVGKDIKSGVSIRGVSSRSPSIGADSAAAIFVDEIYMPRINGAFTALLELERVEILRGPQGTLFGRNATSGAINYITKRPGEELEANVTVGTGNRGLQEMFGTVSAGTSDGKIIGGISAFSRKQDGWNDLVDASGVKFDADDTSDSGVRGVLEFTPTDTLEIRASLSSIETKGSNVELATNTPTGPLVPFFEANGVSPAADYRERETALTFAGDLDREQLLGILRADWSLSDEVTLTSLTGYSEFEMTQDNDIDYAIEDYFTQTIDEESDTLSQEFRLEYRKDGIGWLAGVYYFDDSHSLVEEFVSGDDLGFPLLASFSTEVDTTSTAVFSQVWFDISDKLTLEVGARYTEDERDYFKSGDDGGGGTYASTDDTGFVVPNGPPGTPAIEIDITEWDTNPKWDNWSGTIGLDYHVNDSTMVYAKYSTGYHSGGVQGRAFDVRAAIVNYDEETVKNFEIGIKSQLFDDRMRLNVAAFSMDYDDMQTTRAVVIAGVDQNVIANAAGASIQGIEIETQYLFNEYLSIDFHSAYLDATYDKYRTADDADQAAADYAEGLTFQVPFPATAAELVAFDQSGDFHFIGVRPEDYIYDDTTLPSAPEFTYGLGLNLYTEFGSSNTFKLRVEYNHSDEYLAGGSPVPIGVTDRFSDSQLRDRFIIAEELDTFNVFATFGFADDQWLLRLWGKNLTDEKSAPSAGDIGALDGPIDAPVATTLTWTAGRTYGASITFQL